MTTGTPDTRRTHTIENAEAPADQRFNRRRLFAIAAGAAGALASIPVLGAVRPSEVLQPADCPCRDNPMAEAHDDDDDDDNSGRGSRDDDDGRDHDHDEGHEFHSDDQPEVHIIDDDEDGFYPGTLTIQVGDTVTFVNEDDDAHTATGSNWDTGIMQPGDAAQITFDSPGTFFYSCQIHPEMLGTIEVEGTATPVASPAAEAVAADGETEIAIVNFAFEPSEVEVPVGTTVTWTNEDAVPHTATGADGAFDTGTLGQGEAGSHTFDEPGTYEYVCAIHPSMSAVVTVV